MAFSGILDPFTYRVFIWPKPVIIPFKWIADDVFFYPFIG
mgnify:CR=1 FL=1